MGGGAWAARKGSKRRCAGGEPGGEGAGASVSLRGLVTSHSPAWAWASKARPTVFMFMFLVWVGWLRRVCGWALGVFFGSGRGSGSGGDFPARGQEGVAVDEAESAGFLGVGALAGRVVVARGRGEDESGRAEPLEREGLIAERAKVHGIKWRLLVRAPRVHTNPPRTLFSMGNELWKYSPDYSFNGFSCGHCEISLARLSSMKQNNGLYLMGRLIVFSDMVNVCERESIDMLMIPSEHTFMLLEDRNRVGDLVGRRLECMRCGYDLGWRLDDSMYYIKKDNIT